MSDFTYTNVIYRVSEIQSRGTGFPSLQAIALLTKANPNWIVKNWIKSQIRIFSFEERSEYWPSEAVTLKNGVLNSQTQRSECFKRTAK